MFVNNYLDWTGWLNLLHKGTGGIAPQRLLLKHICKSLPCVNAIELELLITNIRCRGGLVVASEIVVDNFFDENGASKKLSRWKSCRFISNPFCCVNTTPPLMSLFKTNKLETSYFQNVFALVFPSKWQKSFSKC